MNKILLIMTCIAIVNSTQATDSANPPQEENLSDTADVSRMVIQVETISSDHVSLPEAPNGPEKDEPKDTPPPVIK